MKFMASKYDIEYDDVTADFLIDNYFRGKRPFRSCHPRDIMEQIVNASAYQRIQPKFTKDLIKLAAFNYFAAMEHTQPNKVWRLRKTPNFCVALHFVFTAAYTSTPHSTKFATPWTWTFYFTVSNLTFYEFVKFKNIIASIPLKSNVVVKNILKFISVEQEYCNFDLISVLTVVFNNSNSAQLLLFIHNAGYLSKKESRPARE